jgi:putative transposase
MANHVHLLIDPKASLSRINQAVKTFSAREANRILNRKGLAFWANESYDHWVRTLREFENIIRYIEFNPVCAGLVANPEDWRWSSARAGQEARPTESGGNAGSSRPQGSGGGEVEVDR